MHTVVRHTTIKTGFVVVISGRSYEDTVVQVYDTYAVDATAVHPSLVSEVLFADERRAIQFFEETYAPVE